jgi:GDPmannose 4,6-dehydratase
MGKRALLTGIAGQDGRYLTMHLLDNGYEVHGVIRRALHESETSNLAPLQNRIQLHYGDVTDIPSIESVMHAVKPDEVYNLAAQSYVKMSFERPQHTVQVNAIGTLNMLEATRKIVPHARFYQASTSEMFGNQIDPDGFQRETTPMVPVSPYGVSKLFGHNLVHLYRNSYGLFACSGILFNHESPFRGANFVTQKVVRGAVAIKQGRSDSLQLGNLSSHRDWGHAEDYAQVMHVMLQHDTPDDYVIATGVSHTVLELVELVFEKLDLKMSKYVKVNESNRRPEDIIISRGDCSKAKSILHWKPKHSFETTIQDMIDAELNRFD